MHIRMRKTSRLGQRHSLNRDVVAPMIVGEWNISAQSRRCNSRQTAYTSEQLTPEVQNYRISVILRFPQADLHSQYLFGANAGVDRKQPEETLAHKPRPD